MRTPGVELQRDEHGMETVLLNGPSGSSARVHLHGAQVTSWRTSDGRERLFLSAASRFEEGAAIRGGIPVIFPQFADRGPLPKHGFARTSRWRLLEGDGTGVARFALDDSAATRAVWPAEFTVQLEVGLGARELAVALSVTARSRLAFTAALHTYLRVADVADVVVLGLGGARFDSGVDGVRGAVQRDRELRVRGELDRVYLALTEPLVVRGSAGQDVLTVEGEGFPDAVLWNPGPERAKALADLAPEEYRQMLCVEAAVVGQPVQLEAGASWTARQVLRVERP